MKNRTLSLFAALLLLTTAACEDTLTPQEQVAGAYVATTLILSPGGTPVDALAQGARVNLTLHDDLTSSGLLVFPGGSPDGTDFEADLAGTWDVSEGRWVQLHLQSTTFLNNRFLTIGEGVLTVDANDLDLVLTKT